MRVEHGIGQKTDKIKPVRGQLRMWTPSEISNPIALSSQNASEPIVEPKKGYTLEEQAQNDKRIREEYGIGESSIETESPTLSLSRRDFLKATGLLGISVALGGGLTYLLKNQEGNKPESEVLTSGRMILSDQERVFRDEMIGYASWTPDGPITYWTAANGKKRYLLTGGQDNATYMIESDGRSLKEIMGSGEIGPGSLKKVYGPDQNVDYRREYVGITGVLQLDKSNPDHILGISHCERRTSRDASADYTSTVGLSESFDGGLTWTDKGPLIKGTDEKEPGGKRVSGAGQPTAIVHDGYVYIMFIDWSARNLHKDQLYLARAKANDNGTLGNVEYFTDKGFSSDQKEQKSVIPVPDGSNLVYTALPHISWNKDLGKFICEGESDTGFWHSVSDDLINWSKPEIVYDFTKWGGKPHSILKPGEKWDSYPTALSESEPNSQVTRKNGIFYHSSGNNLNPHEPATVDFRIE